MIKKFLKNLLQKLKFLKVRAELPFAMSYFSIPRIYSLSLAINELESNFSKQELSKMAFVECGLGYGESFSFIAWFADRYDANLIGFDSFVGFPEPEHDLDQRTSGPATMKGQWNINSKELILNKLRNMNFKDSFIRENVHLEKGYFEDTLPFYNFNKEICFLNLDVDLYSSYKTCFKHLKDKIAKGGIICLDEYHSEKWAGCKKAVDEFILENNFQLKTDKSSDRAYLIKL